jgi:hypothetical protein
LLNVSVFKPQTQIIDDSVVVIGRFNVHGQGIIVINRIDQLEQMKHIDANDDLLVFALVEFKVFCTQKQMDQNGVRLVHIDDTHPVGLKRNVGLQ